MRKLLLGALMLVASAGLSGSVQAQEPAPPLGQVQMEAPSIARKAGPYTAADAQAVANELVRRGFHFIRYDPAGGGYWYVVYTR
jgi:hypothetical protein